MNSNEQNNNVVNQQVIQPQQMQQNPQTTQATIKPNANKKPFNVKKQNNKVMIIAIVAILVIGAFFIIANKKSSLNIFNNEDPLEEENEIIKIATSQQWGDKYATALQESFLKYKYIEVNGEKREKYIPTEFNIVFIDFLFDETPEMIVKYTDSLGSEAIRIFMINNNEVSETKDFKNTDFRMIYSIREKTLKWYLYITSATSKKYGSYTDIEKILTSTALDSDIKTTTDVEITTFNVNYVTADFRPSFYGVDVESIEKDFKAAVLKYEASNTEATNAKKTIEDNYGSVNVKENVDESEYMIVGKYTLNYGTYVSVVEVIEHGEVTGTREDIITINRNGTVKIGDSTTYKFSIYNNLFMLSDNKSFTILDNNKFQYGTGSGNIYTFKE